MSRAPGWKRPGIGVATVVFVGIAALVVPLVLVLAIRSGSAVASAVPILRARPVRELADGTEGAQVVHGRVVGATATTPTGQEAVAFVAWLDRIYTTGSGKNQRTETDRVCTIRHVGWTAVQDGDTRVPLAVPPRTLTPEPHAHETPTAGTTLVLMESLARGEPPPGLTDRSECRPRAGGRLSYGEIGIRPGTAVVVSGCRGPDGLAPCGDVADAIVARCGTDGSQPQPCASEQDGVAAVVAHWSGGARLVTGIAAGVSGIAATVFASIQLLRHRRERRRRHVDVR